MAVGFAFGEFGLFVMLLLNPGGTPNDLVSWIKPEDYFQARDIEVNAAEMLRLAGTEPKDSKKSLQQLLALRWLAEHPAELKKEKGARKFLETLAAGKMGDTQGFARDYAAAALAVLDGKMLPVRTMPENSVKVDALSWFPEKVTFCGAGDVRMSPDSKLPADDSLRNLGQRALLLADNRVRNEIYSFAELMGNFRVDRVSFAFQFDAQEKNKHKAYIRVTGLGDRARMAKGFENLFPCTVKEEKGPKGEPITIIEPMRARDPVMALVGDNDLIIAGYARGSEGENLKVVQEVLAIRAAGKGSVTGGPHADLLKRVPATASGVVVGSFPDVLRKEIGPGSPFTSLPDRFVVDKTTTKTTEVRWHGTFDKAEDAKAFAGSVAKLKEQGVAGLKSIPEDLKIKKETLALLIKTLEAVKADADGKTVTGGVQISPETTKAVIGLADIFLMGRRPAPPPPPEKNPGR